MENNSIDAHLDDLAISAQSGDKHSLNKLLEKVQGKMYNISLRFLGNPHDAEDACQDINMRIIKNLSNFRGDSKFSTWAYRLAFNLLITKKSQRKPEFNLTFEIFSDGIYNGIGDNDTKEVDNPDYQQLLQEVRIACTVALLQCLDDEARMTYILGEIFEMDHIDGSRVLDITPSNFRKKLSRARTKVNDLTINHCGLVNQNNRCRCRKQVTKSIDMGRLNRDQLIYSDANSANDFPRVLKMIRALKETQRTAELIRQIPDDNQEARYIDWIRDSVSKISKNTYSSLPLEKASG